MIQLTKKTNFLIFILAISCGSLAANIYYAQPIVQFIAKDLNISSDLSGLLTTFTQIGYGLGLFFIVPMADLFKSKKIIGILIGLTIISLIGTLISTNGIIFLHINNHNWHWSLCGSNVSSTNNEDCTH